MAIYAHSEADSAKKTQSNTKGLPYHSRQVLDKLCRVATISAQRFSKSLSQHSDYI